MKLKHISTKFILAFAGTLAVVFAVLFVALNIVFPLMMKNYIQENFLSMQSELDAGVTEVMNESAYLYARMLQSSNAQALNIVSDESQRPEVREKSFAEIVQKSGVSHEYFNGLTLFVGDSKFSSGKSTDLSDRDRLLLVNNKNALMYLGNDVGLVLGMYVEDYSGFSGVLLFNMSERKINDMCNPASGEEGYSLIMRSDGYVVSHRDQSLAGRYIVYSDVYNFTDVNYKRVTLDGVRSIVVTSRANLMNSRYGMDCVIISVLDYNYYFGQTETMLLVVSAVSAVALAVAVVIAVVQAKNLSKPIALLSDKINSTKELSQKQQSVLSQGDELEQLERNYDEMILRIFDLVEKQKEDMQLQRKLELESLQMQINPHFLYNTLDAISWMAKIKKQPDIDKLVMNLAKFFRLFLHNGDKFVTVADEIEMVKSYLEIDKIRKSAKVNYTFEIADGLADKKVLKLILQPIIENCLKHAFGPDGGNIGVKVYLQGEDVLFEVQDDGVGFDVPNDILTHQPQKEGGYGLINVHERLVLQYGDGYGLQISSQKGSGTNVKIRLKCE